MKAVEEIERVGNRDYPDYERVQKVRAHLGILQHDVPQLETDIFTLIGCGLQVFVNFLHLQDVDGVTPFEELRNRIVEQRISLIFEPVHLSASLLDLVFIHLSHGEERLMNLINRKRYKP